MHCFEQRKLRIKSQREQHQKEQKTPERSERKFSDHFWIHFESQSDSLINYVGHFRVRLKRQISDYGEDSEAGKDAGQNVGQRHDQCITLRSRNETLDEFRVSSIQSCRYSPEAVVVKSIVRRKSDESSPGRAQREKDLHCSIAPHLSAEQKIKVGSDVEEDAIDCAG